MKNVINIFTKEACETMKGMDRAERREKLAGAITAFFQGKHPAQLDQIAPAMHIAKELGVDQELVQKVIAAMVQKGMTGPSDAANLMNRNTPVTADVFYTSVLDPLASFGFEEIFDLVDMRGSGQTSFDILDVTNAITFAEVKSGEKMKVYGISDGKSSVSKMIIAAAIGILDDWINYAQFWNLNQAVVEARSKYYDKMATDHYSVFSVACAVNAQLFATDDITTINNACAARFTALASLGYVLTGNERFLLRANPALKARIEKAFALTFNGMSTSPNQLVHNIDRAYSTKLSSSYIYLGLPGRKAKRGIWSDLKAETDRDILLRGTDVAYSGEYNMAVGETAQFTRLNLS